MPVAFMSGKLVSFKRGKDLIQVVSTDADILASCSGHCGNHTAIIIENGIINKDDLLIQEGEEDGKGTKETEGNDNTDPEGTQEDGLKEEVVEEKIIDEENRKT
jgi:hypothetical protein